MRIRIVSRFPSLFLSSLESVSQAGRVRYIVICINPALTKMKDGTEKPQIPSKVAKRAARYKELRYNAHFSLRATCWLRGGTGGQFPQKRYNDPEFACMSSSTV